MDDSCEPLQLETAVRELAATGYSVSTGIVPLDLVADLVAELHRREGAGELRLAEVGHGTERRLRSLERQAHASWLTGQSDGERRFLDFAERVRLAINCRLMLGLFEFEAQFLHYPPGGFYRRHIDALRGARARVVSMVAYLNADWASDAGGGLAIWAADGADEPAQVVMPLAGTVVLMLSEEIPHEVMVSVRERRAIAGWFRINPGVGAAS